MRDCVMLLLLPLAFKGDGNVIGEFKVRVCVSDDLSSLDEPNIPQPDL
jgi:hypothetical protein